MSGFRKQQNKKFISHEDGHIQFILLAPKERRYSSENVKQFWRFILINKIKWMKKPKTEEKTSTKKFASENLWWNNFKTSQNPKSKTKACVKKSEELFFPSKVMY